MPARHSLLFFYQLNKGPPNSIGARGSVDRVITLGGGWGVFFFWWPYSVVKSLRSTCVDVSKLKGVLVT